MVSGFYDGLITPLALDVLTCCQVLHCFQPWMLHACDASPTYKVMLAGCQNHTSASHMPELLCAVKGLLQQLFKSGLVLLQGLSNGIGSWQLQTNIRNLTQLLLQGSA